MSKNQLNEPVKVPAKDISDAEVTIVTEHQATEDRPTDTGMELQSDGRANGTPVSQEADSELAAGEAKISPANAALGANEARRLVVVPGHTGAAAVRPNTPAAKQAQRQAWLAARAARAAAIAHNNPAQVKPLPVRERPAPLEAWPELTRLDGVLSTMRRSRQRRFFGRLALFVGLPTLLVMFYVFVWASPRYVSEFEITYQTYQNTQSLSSGLVQSVLGGGSSAGVDIGSILYEYTRSATLLHKLDEKLNLRKYYSGDNVDYPARMSRNVSDDAFLRYYRSHIVDVSEGLGGYLTIDVQAFDPEFSQALAKEIVRACDEMVDQMTARARQDGMKFAEDEVARQEDRVRQAQIALTRFQNEHRDLNPTNTANQFGQIVGSLETQLAQTRTALANTESYAAPNAPQVLQLKNQIAALETQLQQQRDRLTGGDKTYSEILEEYSRLQLEQQFAQTAYQSAQQGLAVARADAARKQSYLVDFVTPSHPDGPTRSFYIEYLSAAFLGSLFLYAVGSLLAGAFRDQAGL